MACARGSNIGKTSELMGSLDFMIGVFLCCCDDGNLNVFFSVWVVQIAQVV